MTWPWVSRALLDAANEDRMYLRSEVARLAEETRRLTDATLANARLVPASAFAQRDRKERAFFPRRSSVVGLARELEAKESS